MTAPECFSEEEEEEEEEEEDDDDDDDDDDEDADADADADAAVRPNRLLPRVQAHLLHKQVACTMQGWLKPLAPPQHLETLHGTVFVHQAYAL